jgi:DNA-binding NtrC family response regulator
MPLKDAIVCVDDEAIILFALKQELRANFGNKFIYETALNANKAYEIIDDLVNDGIKNILVISDWIMPGIKGDAFLIEINRKYPNIKGIIISGQAHIPAIENAKKECNLIAFINKPWVSSELINIIKETLSI